MLFVEDVGLAAGAEGARVVGDGLRVALEDVGAALDLAPRCDPDRRHLLPRPVRQLLRHRLRHQLRLPHPPLSSPHPG